jgi:hypothetical protein
MNLFRRDLTPPITGYRHAPPLTIRWAGPDDAEHLEVLAELDETPVPPAPLMLGLVDDEVWAAVSVSTGRAIADPFKPSAEVARLVAERGHQFTVPEPRSRWGLARRHRRPAQVSLRARLGQGAL